MARHTSRAASDLFVAHVLEMLGELGDIRARAMFGGHGIYHRDLMVGLIADGVLYLKVDEQNRSQFEQEGSQPFEFQRKDRAEPITMSYWEAPTEALHNPRALCEWTRTAYTAAVRSAKAKKPVRGKRKKSPRHKKVSHKKSRRR